MSAASPKVPLVLLSGLLCDGFVWEAVAERLANAARVTTFGFAGRTTIEDMAGQVLAGAPETFALAGHSMGGRVALEVYRTAPRRVERLALLNTGTHPVSAAEVPGRHRLLRIAEAEGMAAVADTWLPPMVGPAGARDPALMNQLRAMVLRYTTQDFAGQIHALLNRPDAEAVLSRIDVPTLLVASDEDRWSPPAQHQAMQRHVHGSRLVILEGVGHMSPVEAPDAVTDAIKDWLTWEAA